MASTLAPGSRVAGWRVEGLLGAGAMGHVYRAADAGSGDPAALKVVLPELAGDERFRQRFEREARLASELSDPHLVAVLDSGEADGRLFLAMRYVDGPDLAAVLAERG